MDQIVKAPDFSRIENRILDLQRKREALEKTQQVLKDSQDFSDSDHKLVDETLLGVLREQRNLMVDLAQRKKVYEDTVKNQQLQVAGRQEALSLINDTTSTFELFPELAQSLALRQAELIQAIEESKRLLELE